MSFEGRGLDTLYLQKLTRDVVLAEGIEMKGKHVLYAYRKGYRVSEDGVVTSSEGNERKLRVSNRGYLTFSVHSSKDKINGPCSVHKLAALQWFGILELDQPGIQVRHLDGNPRNNKRNNLALGTQSQNMMDRSANDRLVHARKAAKVLRRFTDEQVRTIRSMKVRGSTHRELCEEYNVAKSTISYIVNRKTYQDVR